MSLIAFKKRPRITAACTFFGPSLRQNATIFNMYTVQCTVALLIVKLYFLPICRFLNRHAHHFGVRHGVSANGRTRCANSRLPPVSVTRTVRFAASQCLALSKDFRHQLQVVHQWFGDLVGFCWWNDYWMIGSHFCPDFVL